MEKYRIRGALGGGFGGCKGVDWEEIEVENEEEAWQYAYELACGEYDQYVGYHGLRTVEEIMEEDGIDEDEAYEVWLEERESWLNYECERID
jgi:hypothetical protein